MKIIAIDPGYERLGIAVVEKNNGKEILVFSECFKTSAKLKMPERLFLLGQELEKVIKKYKPEAFAIEKLFFANNQKTVMGVSEARGVLIYEASKAGLPVHEYTPLEIKTAITGSGRADKTQVAKLLHMLIKIPAEKTSDDELDAIACALTFFARERYPQLSK